MKLEVDIIERLMREIENLLRTSLVKTLVEEKKYEVQMSSDTNGNIICKIFVNVMQEGKRIRNFVKTESLDVKVNDTIISKI